jgi:hypothetical protein
VRIPMPHAGWEYPCRFRLLTEALVSEVTRFREPGSCSPPHSGNPARSLLDRRFTFMCRRSGRRTSTPGRSGAMMTRLTRRTSNWVCALSRCDAHALSPSPGNSFRSKARQITSSRCWLRPISRNRVWSRTTSGNRRQFDRSS